MISRNRWFFIAAVMWIASGPRIGTARADDFQVNTFTANMQYRPSVALEAEGDFVVAWENDGSSGSDSLSVQGVLSGQSVDGDAAYSVINERTAANREVFFIYQDADSGLNRGFPSGFFGKVEKIQLDAACLDDPGAVSGCTSDPERLDQQRGNVLRIAFDPLLELEFAGVNFEEPENWGVSPNGVGYSLSGSTDVVLDVRSPDGLRAQFGVGGCVTGFMSLSQNWTEIGIALNSLAAPPGQMVSCPPDLNDVHILFTVVTNGAKAPSGGTVLLDNIRFEPIPEAQTDVLSFPLGNETFGVVPFQESDPGRIPIPPDQVLRNLTTIYESALVIFALLDRGTPQDLENARWIADAFHYALNHDNAGDPLPVAPDGTTGLHSGYSTGDVMLRNDQGPGAGQAGEVRLAGFSAELCGPTRFCLVLDGATGGNNAFVMLALLDAYETFGDNIYFDDARTIGRWIVGLLTDETGTGFGGYYLGYPDEGVPPPKPLLKGKSIENVADIFVAFTRLAEIEARLGNASDAAMWTQRANIAGDFVMEMFDDASGCFFAGTVPTGTDPGPGIDPSGDQLGNDITNIFLFLDANTFTTMALAEAPRYRDQIDWRRPVQCVLDRYKRVVTVGGQGYSGFSIDQVTAVGPDGIAWEFVAQAVVLMRLVDALYGETAFEADAAFYLDQIALAQANAPFGDGRGLVASTLEGGDALPPLEQCLTTPFQCIPQRVGLAATAWAIFAHRNLNPLSLAPVDCLVGADCDDGLFCNGVESCTAGICQSGTPVACDDGVVCTVDSCNEGTDSCDNTPDDGACDNGLFCDGAETCDAALDCQAGTPPSCDDGVSCTDDACNENTDSCDNVANDGNCDNGQFCDGAETCNLLLDCLAGAPSCDDGVSCTVDSCDEATDSCDSVPDDVLCDNGLFCDGAETCDPALDCQAGSDPCAPMACDEGSDICLEAAIFADGFESGDTSEWSGEVP